MVIAWFVHTVSDRELQTVTVRELDFVRTYPIVVVGGGEAQ